LASWNVCAIQYFHGNEGSMLEEPMTEELSSIKETIHGSIVICQKGIGHKWAFKLKKDRDGNIVMHKARLVG
jgi:hypothetical protein